MLSLFQRKRRPVAAAPTPAPATGLPKALLRPESAASLLATPRRQFITLYRTPLEERYAELVQRFPASESHHHAYPGGMLDHGLEIVAYGLKLRQSHLLPVGTSPEDQAAQSEAWTAAVAYAALLHDIGKLAVDLHVELADGSTWHPWHGPLRQPYRFRYRDDREYRLHSAATGLLYRQLLDGPLLDWLSGYPALWGPLLYVLAGQYEHAGVLGELVVQADRASVAQELGGDPARAMAAPKHALQRKLLDGLRYLLKEELKLNQAGPSDGWLTHDALWLVSKTVSDKLRAHLLSQGIDGIPANNIAVFNVLQEHGIALPTPEGNAIWKATITSDGGWSHMFTVLKLSPALIWEAGERPEPFKGSVHVDQDSPASTIDQTDTSMAAASNGIPITNAAPTAAAMSEDTATRPADTVDALLNLLDTGDGAMSTERALPDTMPASAGQQRDEVSSADVPKVVAEQTTEDPPSSEDFIAWLRDGIQARRLIINDAKALVHTVADSAYLVSPGVFQRYAQEHPGVAALAKPQKLADWQWVQKRFEQLHVHRKQASRLNIWTCEVTGPRKSRRLHGYLLNDPKRLFEDAPPNNPYLKVMDEE